MTKLIAAVLMLVGMCTVELRAQDSAAPGLSSTAKKKPANKPATPTKPPADNEDKKDEGDPLKKAFGGGLTATSNEPVTTEIFSDEAFFDSGKSIGIFSGHVLVKDPRFNLQADKLTVYLGKGETRGLERAVAEGNIGMIREAPGENGGPPVRSIGRADMAVYTAADGNVELRGTPRVQSGVNSHIATSPDTVMVINQGGQLTTKGPSRTEIKQEPKNPAPAAPAPAPPKP